MESTVNIPAAKETKEPVMSGKLTLTVIEAKLTRDTEAFGKMDPFVKVTIGAKTVKTKVKEDAGKEPVWNETFEFTVDHKEDDIFLEIHEEDAFSDDFIGDATFRISALCQDDPESSGIQEWFEIKYEGKSAG